MRNLFLMPKMFIAFYFIFYSYLWAGNKLGLNLVISFQIELVSFYLFLLQYRSGMVNSNMVNSKFHLIQSYCEYLARILSFHV